jgi:nicotinic acid mononucleotide adenylyltransferase
MCVLATASFGNALTVSTIEEEVGASNGEMLKALKTKYPPGTRFLWICGDDFIRWMDRPKGIETLQEVSGLIVQRRLHKQTAHGDNATSSSSLNRFVQEPLDDAKMRKVANQLNLEIDFIYGELPHFSSTLVRRAPGHWRSFLTQSVVQYLDERPHLLQQLIDNLDQDEPESLRKKAKTQKDAIRQQNDSWLATLAKAGAYVLQGLDVVNALQLERGRMGLHLSTGKFKEELKIAQGSTDARLVVNHQPIDVFDSLDEVMSLVAELKRTREWLNQDRAILEKRSEFLMNKGGPDGWNARLAMVEKYNSRIDVLIGATIRALVEILENHHLDSQEEVDYDVPELLLKWCEGKEALGRLRAFICAAGPEAPKFVQMSFKMRERLTQTIETKERCIDRVMALERGLSSRLSSPDALHKLLENVTLWEYKLMGCFAPSTPLRLIHKFLENSANEMFMKGEFDVEKFFDASTAAIDFLLSFAKALAASACATA